MSESKPDINKILFMHLVSMLAMSAIQQMGKLVDPNTGKAETNLEAAQATIDMLDMLELKTRGNLDAEETKLIKDTLMSLKMNYVESQGRTADDRRQTPDTRPAKAGGGAEDAGRKTDDRRQTTDPGPAKAGGGAEDADRKTDGGRQTPDDGPAKAGSVTDKEKQTTDDGRQTTDAGPAKAGGGNEDKTPKYHKKYE